MADLREDEVKVYESAMAIHKELSGGNFEKLRTALIDLRDQLVERLAFLKGDDFLVEQGKLKAVNMILNYKKTIESRLEYFKKVEELDA